MILLVAALALLVVALAIIFAIVLLDRSRTSDLSEFLAAEHLRTLDSGRLLHTMVETFAFRITEASQRESADIKMLLDAATGERRALITALLSMSADPRAAQRFGMVEQTLDRSAHNKTAEQLLKDLYADDKRTEADDFPRDGDGNPVQLVGMSQ